MDASAIRTRLVDEGRIAKDDEPLLLVHRQKGFGPPKVVASVRPVEIEKRVEVPRRVRIRCWIAQSLRHLVMHLLKCLSRVPSPRLSDFAHFFPLFK